MWALRFSYAARELIDLEYDWAVRGDPRILEPPASPEPPLPLFLDDNATRLALGLQLCARPAAIRHIGCHNSQTHTKYFCLWQYYQAMPPLYRLSACLLVTRHLKFAFHHNCILWHLA